MEAIASWLKRIKGATAESNLQATVFRTIFFGEQALDLDNWLMNFDPQGSIHNTPHSLGSESWSLLRLPDVAQQETKLHERHRLGADLAAAISLAVGRRVVIPNDLAISVPGVAQTFFQPVSHVVDRSILGPLGPGVRERLGEVFTAIHGLPDEDFVVIGAATSAHHSALLLFDKEPRVAYTLLVAGIETLSRRYGVPPTDWESWNESSRWTHLFSALQLQPTQISAIRDHLMKDRQLSSARPSSTMPPRVRQTSSGSNAWMHGFLHSTQVLARGSLRACHQRIKFLTSCRRTGRNCERLSLGATAFDHR